MKTRVDRFRRSARLCEGGRGLSENTLYNATYLEVLCNVENNGVFHKTRFSDWKPCIRSIQVRKGFDSVQILILSHSPSSGYTPPKEMSLLVLSASDVDTLFSEFHPEELQLMMARLFCRFSSQNSGERTSLSMPPRLRLPMPNHTALFMPARIGPSQEPTSASAGALGDTSVKVVCVPNQSNPRGLPATTMVLDERTGGVKAIVNARRLTALRNAAGTSPLRSPIWN